MLREQDAEAVQRHPRLDGHQTGRDVGVHEPSQTVGEHLEAGSDGSAREGVPGTDRLDPEALPLGAEDDVGQFVRRGWRDHPPRGDGLVPAQLLHITSGSLGLGATVAMTQAFTEKGCRSIVPDK